MARNRAMTEKLGLPFPLLADETAAAIDAWDVYDPNAKIARPAIFVVGPDLSVPYRYVGRDFADRPPFADLLAAVDEVAGRPPRPLSTSGPARGPREPVDSGKRAFPLEELVPYLRGASFAVSALAARSADPTTREEAKRYQEIVAEFMKHAIATQRERG